MPERYADELTVARQIAYEAGEIMRRYFYIDQHITKKADGTSVTIADTEVNSMVIARLQQAFPADGVIGEEESTAEYGSGRLWFCDPIDGTKAYTWRVPTAMFSLGLVVDGEPVLGVCYEPMTDRLYTAVRGQGAVCNNMPIRVNEKPLATGIVGTTSSQFRIRRRASYLDALLDQRVEMAAFSGAVSMIMRVAEGVFVAYFEDLVNAHDVAASQVILEEAGGILTAPDGSRLDYSKPFRGALSTNAVVRDEMLAILRDAA